LIVCLVVIADATLPDLVGVMFPRDMNEHRSHRAESGDVFGIHVRGEFPRIESLAHDHRVESLDLTDK